MSTRLTSNREKHPDDELLKHYQHRTGLLLSNPNFVSTLNMQMKLTPEQSAIVNSTDVIKIKAVAGSGNHDSSRKR